MSPPQIVAPADASPLTFGTDNAARSEPVGADETGGKYLRVVGTKTEGNLVTLTLKDEETDRISTMTRPKGTNVSTLDGNGFDDKEVAEARRLTTSGKTHNQVVAALLNAKDPATSKYPTADIQNIAAGNKVVTRNPITGETEIKTVTRTFKRTAYELVKAEFADAGTGKVIDTITGTPEHPFFVEGGNMAEMGQLQIGTKVSVRAGPALIVKSITHENYPRGIPVYNIEVEGDHTYFVGKANGGIWVHNDCWDDITKLKLENFGRLGAAEQTVARRITDVFQQRYMSGTGTPLHQIRNVRNLGGNLYEIKSDQGVRVYLDKMGNVVGYSNKSNQDATITRLQKLLGP